jgi:hypothetical protein
VGGWHTVGYKRVNPHHPCCHCIITVLLLPHRLPVVCRRHQCSPSHHQHQHQHRHHHQCRLRQCCCLPTPLNPHTINTATTALSLEHCRHTLKHDVAMVWATAFSCAVKAAELGVTSAGQHTASSITIWMTAGSICLLLLSFVRHRTDCGATNIARQTTVKVLHGWTLRATCVGVGRKMQQLQQGAEAL